VHEKGTGFGQAQIITEPVPSPVEDETQDIPSGKLDLPDAGKIFNPMTIKRGVVVFVIITILTMTGIFLYTNTGTSVSALEDLHPIYLLVILPLLALDLWLGGLRIHIFVRKLSDSARTWLSFKANLANIFMGAITPSQTGGGPAQLFILQQGGISVARGMSIGVINFLSTIVFFVLAAGIALVFLGSSFSSGAVNGLILAGFAVFSFQLLVVLTALLKPVVFEKLFNLLTKLFSRIPSIGRRVDHLRNWFSSFVNSYRESCRIFFSHELAVVFQSFALTVLLYLNKFTIAYFLMRSIGGQGAYVDVVAIHMLVFFVSYFAPSPGASGVAELTTAALMSAVISRNLLPVFALLQRFFLLYIPVILGVFTVLSALKRTERRAAEDAPGKGGS